MGTDNLLARNITVPGNLIIRAGLRLEDAIVQGGGRGLIHPAYSAVLPETICRCMIMLGPLVLAEHDSLTGDVVRPKYHAHHIHIPSIV